MKNPLAVSSNGGRGFNTLAQSGTERKGYVVQIPGLVKGNGTKLSDEKQLKSWAKKKTITQKVMLALIDIAKANGESERVKSYWRTYRCFQNVKSSGDSVYGEYCKNRFCPLCCGIRKAEILNSYLSVLKTWKEPYFLTLTVKSPFARNLKRRIDEMYKVFNKIISKYRKRGQRGKGMKMIGIKSLESNFNAITKTYNPHFHIVVQSQEMAEILRKEWIIEGRRIWGQYAISPKAQKYSRVYSFEKCLVEVIKYSTKIFTKKDIEQDQDSSKPKPMIYAAAYHNIIVAMKGRRIFDRFGFDLPKRPNKMRRKHLLKEFKEWEFANAYFDWVEKEGELTLSNYKPPHELTRLLEKNIDKHLE